MKLLTLLFLLSLLLLPTHSFSDTINVGVRSVEPFACVQDGKWRGYLIDLMEEMNLGHTINYTEMDNLPDALEKTAAGNVSFSIGPFSMTKEREKQVDFSHPFMSSSIGMATNKKASIWSNIIWIGQRLLIGAAGLIALLYLVGFVVDKMDGDTKIKNSHEGAWWALVTFSTVGYGDLVPETTRGKLLASGWIIASLFLVSIFTGYISSAMTVKKLSEAPTSLNLLNNSAVATINGSTSEHFLNVLGIRYKGFDNVGSAVESLRQRSSEVLVYDKPILEYFLRDDDISVVNVPSATLEHYAFIFPEDSEVIEEVNRGLLTVMKTQEGRRIYNSYF